MEVQRLDTAVREMPALGSLVVIAGNAVCMVVQTGTVLKGTAWTPHEQFTLRSVVPREDGTFRASRGGDEIHFEWTYEWRAAIYGPGSWVHGHNLI